MFLRIVKCAQLLSDFEYKEDKFCIFLKKNIAYVSGDNSYRRDMFSRRVPFLQKDQCQWIHQHISYKFLEIKIMHNLIL